MFKNKALVVFIILFIVGFFIYANSFSNQFFWDDNDSIVNNSYIKEWKFLPQFFSNNLIAGAGQVTNYWRPILLISFSLDYHIWGLVPAGFHLTNTILHILCAWLVFLFLIKLFEKTREDGKLKDIDFFVTFLVSLFFLVHPLQTEAVTYIAGRADPLSTFFSLLVVLFYVNYRNTRKILFLAYSLLFFVLGLMTKEQVIFLPFIVLLIELIFFIGKFNKKNITRSLKILSPFFVLSILYFILRMTLLNFNDILGGVKNIGDAYAGINIFGRIFTFFKVMLNYFWLLFIPIGLHMAREVAPVTSIFSWQVLLFITTTILIVFVCKKTWKKERLITFGFLWFFIMLLPRMNIIKINRPMYEHWLYLPMVGFWLAIFLLISLGIKEIKDSKRKEIINSVFVTVVFVLVLAFCVLTIARNRAWNNPIIFYENNLRHTPNSFIQHNNLGMAYADIGAYDRAIINYKKAIEIKDIYPQVHSNLAGSLFIIGEVEEAVSEYKKAIEISPTFLLPYRGLFNIYLFLEQEDELRELMDEMEGYFGDNIDFLQLKAEVYNVMRDETKFEKTLKK